MSEPSNVDFPALYDSFVNWESRLALEIPFIVGQLESIGGRRILDVACGTGRHAIALAGAGYEVEGVDHSAEMVDCATANARDAGAEIAVHLEDMRQFAGLGLSPADALLCLGNAIPQLTTETELRRAMQSFCGALRPGGVAIVHQRNWHRVWSREEREMPVKSATIDDREWLFLRLYDFQPDRHLQFHVVWLERKDDGWQMHRHDVAMRAWLRDDVLEAAEGLFETVGFFGRFDGSPHEPLESPDLIWVGTACGR